MVAKRKQMMREHNQRAWLAWHIAALQRSKKLPPLSKMQTSEAGPRRQTWQEQLAIAAQWVNAGVGRLN